VKIDYLSIKDNMIHLIYYFFFYYCYINLFYLQYIMYNTDCLIVIIKLNCLFRPVLLKKKIKLFEISGTKAS